MPRTIRVSSNALGSRRRVRVLIYETLEELREAASRFNGSVNDDALGVCQTVHYDADDSLASVVVRLCRDHLGTQVVSHEVMHAASAIYGDWLPPGVWAKDVLTNANEDFTHLFSDLLARLVGRLYDLGYYE